MVEGTGLENRQAGNRLVGSNPTPSATHVAEAAASISNHSDTSASPQRDAWWRQNSHTIRHSHVRRLIAILAPRTAAKNRRPWEGPAHDPSGSRLVWVGMSDILLRIIAFFVLTTATTLLMVLAYF